ncbi:universal stress protein [Geothermobacter hydrogeniphilus]|uniref:Universal stress protein n=1 Tax=Geothermobacter hydrogeniphilus TaxID=1969733 RepID=A0A2K2HE76_9BACT|nr:universal stress protein [Geothermobacter hydrogeniphilus]PNU21553.1 universal stress protein [Geothermobacter hydrogeniphilus]
MLPQYQNILVTTDLSPNSEHAFRHAVMLARHNDARIHLLHVVPEIDATVRSYVAAVMGEGKLEDFEAQHETRAQAAIHAEIDHFATTELTDHPEDLKRFAGSIVTHGPTVAKILQVADQIKADVIVMGTHGKGALEYTFLGSTAEKVLRKSKRPVFAIPLPN